MHRSGWCGLITVPIAVMPHLAGDQLTTQLRTSFARPTANEGEASLRTALSAVHLVQLVHLGQLEVAVADLLMRDAKALHRALETSGDEVEVALSRETVELICRLVDARARGEEIVVSPGGAEVAPTEAAVLLGMSRPQVRRLMDRGLLEFRKVGTHHRIRVSSIRAFLESERPRRREAVAELAALQDELGLTEATVLCTSQIR
jgi:excisionase family DNA binding protein